MELCEAREVLAADRDGTSDPYAVIELGAAQEKSQAKQNTRNPVWNEAFSLKLDQDDPELVVNTMTVSLYDYNKIEKHSFLGKVEVDLVKIAEDEEPFEEWIELGGKSELGRVTGEVRLKIRLDRRSLGKEPGAPTTKSVSVALLEAKGLVAADRGGTSDPFVQVNITGQKMQKTKVIKKTLDPQWNETKSFVLAPSKADPDARLEGKILSCEVFDFDLIGGNDFLGQVSFPLSNLNVQEVFDQWLPLKPREGKEKKDKVTGSIHVQVVITEGEEAE
mmetsp:Transcript_25250/g.39631  ORF Transcript_25250/g.39631 Transcript_25250/m.39631 type:complete len:277 (+) Transcript_25250:363-1193(+)